MAERCKHDWVDFTEELSVFYGHPVVPVTRCARCKRTDIWKGGRWRPSKKAARSVEFWIGASWGYYLTLLWAGAVDPTAHNAT